MLLFSSLHCLSLHLTVSFDHTPRPPRFASSRLRSQYLDGPKLQICLCSRQFQSLCCRDPTFRYLSPRYYQLIATMSQALFETMYGKKPKGHPDTARLPISYTQRTRGGIECTYPYSLKLTLAARDARPSSCQFSKIMTDGFKHSGTPNARRTRAIRRPNHDDASFQSPHPRKANPEARATSASRWSLFRPVFA